MLALNNNFAQGPSTFQGATMRDTWEIKNQQSEKVGSLTFGEFDLLRAERTATGFELRIPVRVSLRLSTPEEPLPLLSDVGGVIAVPGEHGSALTLGKLESEWFHSGAHGEGQFDRDYHLIWRGSFVDLAVYEKMREGRAPHFQFILRGQLCYLLQSEEPRYEYRTQPQSQYGDVEIKYDKEKWVRILRDVGIRENVLIEIPLSQSPATEWDEVWKAVVDARNYFEQGGDTGWKGCVSSVRLALEKWHKLEPEEQGLPNWKAPSPQDKESRSKQHRLDAMRWHLLQLAHLSPHTHADIWTREDAILLLSTLSSLLAEKHS
jgi:hypothetical protein